MREVNFDEEMWVLSLSLDFTRVFELFLDFYTDDGLIGFFMELCVICIFLDELVIYALRKCLL